jgi:hypothetical protein
MKHTEMITVIQAYQLGKDIQVRRKYNGDPWVDTTDPTFDFSDCEYRAKPEPKYSVKTHRIKGVDIKHYEAKAVEDALKLTRGLESWLSSDDLEIYDELKSLIK